MNKPPTSREIERWSPSKWDEIAGNSELVGIMQGFVANGPCNTLVTGPKRSGKTRTIKHAIKSMLCRHRSGTLDPCGACTTCTEVDSAHGSETGLFAFSKGNGMGFVQIDCENVSDSTLKTLANEIRWDNPRLIVYLDEVGALGRRGQDSLLLKPVDEWPCVWIASAVEVTKKRLLRGKRSSTPGLSDALTARFAVKVGTALPVPDDIVTWLKDRCQDWQVSIDDPEKTLPLLAQRAQYRIGYAKQPIAVAAAKGNTLATRRLTYDDVIGFAFTA